MIPASSSHSQQMAATTRGWWPRARTSFAWMFVIGLLLRVGDILMAPTNKFKGIEGTLSFGGERGRLGRAFALGGGFADPFNAQTGRRAWEPPLYPYLIAGVFRLTGVYTNASALILL